MDVDLQVHGRVKPEALPRAHGVLKPSASSACQLEIQFSTRFL